MKTPETIKKGLVYCNGNHPNCSGCPYDTDEDYENKCLDDLQVDALDYIIQLESRLEQMGNIIRLLTKAKDAAICDMVQIVHEMDDIACKWCKNAYFDEAKCKECRFHNESFEWQGVQPTNTKDGADA